MTASSLRPHFYRTYSRLGMINLPNKGTEFNIGVENGPDAVLSPAFLKQFTEAADDSYRFSLPEAIDPLDYQQVIAAESDAFASLINRTLEPSETQIVVGGDHSIAFGSLLAVLSRTDAAKVGYIQFDSHGDVHCFNTSPSGNFHGMWLRPFIGNFDSPAIAKIAPYRLRPGQIMFVGNTELEPAETEVFKEHRIETVNSEALAANRQATLQSLGNFASRYSHLHISFDIDVFNQRYVQATGTPAENGMSASDIFDIIGALSAARRRSIDLVEVNPQKAHAQPTINMARKVLTALISA